MRYFWAVLVSVIALSAGPFGAAAEFEDNVKEWTDWGAVALGPGGAYGFALHTDTGSDAERAARAACHSACTRVLAFHDGCGAVAMGRKGVGAWAFGASADEARQHAIELCTLDAEGCRIRAQGCTD